VASQAYARGFQLKAYALDNRKNITNEWDCDLFLW
jgi:hypothetical protein